jgi:hypothetical protein
MQKSLQRLAYANMILKRKETEKIMPANPENPRVNDFHIKDAEKLIADLAMLTKKAKALRETLSGLPSRSIKVDGGKGARDGIKEINKFIVKCTAAANL